MMEKYFETTVFWGGSGREYASKMAEKLNALHEQEYMPIKAYIFDKQAMDSASIMNSVMDKLDNSSACIIVLTFDDDGGTRVRQNVLLETGAAWAKLGRDNLIFLSEKSVLPDDFPSNIKGEIQINHFDRNSIDDTVERVCKELLQTHRITSARDRLTEPSYIFDGRVLDDIDQSIRAGKTEAQLRSIIECWSDNVKRYDYLQEKILYILERVAFFPVMGDDDGLLEFLGKIKDHIAPTKLDLSHYENGKLPAEYENAMILAKQIVDYTELKSRKDTRECIRDPSENVRATDIIERKFRSIFSEIKKVIDTFESDECRYIWLVRIVAYDYAALCQMKMYEIDSDFDSEENRKDLDEAIRFFTMAIDIAKRHDTNSGNLWLGYLQYNIARAYHKKYLCTHDRQYLSMVKDNLLDSIGYRERWSKNEYYKGIFATALSYEYFLASFFDCKLRDQLEGYTKESKDDNLMSLQHLRSELYNYCVESELGVLYRMLKDVDDYIESRRN